MHRRLVLQATLATVMGMRTINAGNDNKIDLTAVIDLLESSSQSGMLDAASLYVRHRDFQCQRAFGKATTEHAVFLLASITKPISVAAVMNLFDQGQIALDDPVAKYIPEFRGDRREAITLQHLMTHVSGLPDQLPENADLRASHAPLSQFVNAAITTPLLFPAGTKYSYSSLGILLASEVASRICGQPFPKLVAEHVFRPLGMKRSALGIGNLDRSSLMRCQVERAAAESGGGNPDTKSWDWNSDYWRKLGAPWGGGHGSASDVARFLEAFLHPDGILLKAETARRMIANHNPPGIRPRGLGFDLGKRLAGSIVSNKTFGHGGSTGTLCWADPESDTVFVILTTLPSTAANPHPRITGSQLVAKAVAGGDR